MGGRSVCEWLSVVGGPVEALLERLEHRLPIHAGRLHPNQRHPRLGKPAGKLREPGQRRLERLRLLVPLSITAARYTDVATTLSRCTSRPAHRSTITSTALLPSDGNWTLSPAGGLPLMSLSFALAAAINGPTGPRATLRTGSNAPSLTDVDPGPKDSHPSKAAGAPAPDRCRVNESNSHCSRDGGTTRPRILRFEGQVPVISNLLAREHLSSRRPIDAPASRLVCPTTRSRSSSGDSAPRRSRR
jgi:hypothetical protein